MSQITNNTPTKILQPQFTHCAPSPITQHPEPAKPVKEGRLFLVPKHLSCPLALQNRNSLDNRQFAPHFDKFSLSHLATDKDLSQEDINQFTHLREEEDQKAQPTADDSKGESKAWGSFTYIEKHPPHGISIPKSERGPEVKRSRPKQKGLRKLSQRAYEIVLNMKSASYKEVANRLVDELNNQQELDNGEKDEQNIKRRVYDALNVLIALGVLRKEGRKIVGDRENQLNFEEGKAKRLRRELIHFQETLKNKRCKLQQLASKHKIYDNMCKRQVDCDEDKKIRFPFMVLLRMRDRTLQGVGDGGECTHLNAHLQRSAGDLGYFDIDCLLEYNKMLERVGASE